MKLVIAALGVALAAGAAQAQSVFQCEWDNGDSATYRVAPGSWQVFRDAAWAWADMPCDEDSNRFGRPPVCEVQITDGAYSWTLRVEHIEPGVWVKSGFDQIAIDRRTGVANYKEYGGTSYFDPEIPDSLRDSVMVGRCQPAADPALQARPAPLL